MHLSESNSTYAVKTGDTLDAIAKTTDGDLMMYKAIFERNADRLGPVKIYAQNYLQAPAE